MHFRIQFLLKYFIELLPYLRVTFTYAGLALLFGLLFGSVLAAMKLQKIAVIRWIGVIYTAIFRSIPPVVLLFLVYYGLPQLVLALFGYNLQGKDCIFFVIITVSILSMVSLSEIIRSAYASVDRGQYEAAISMGLHPVMAMIRIVFPQMIFIALPSIGNVVIYLIKEGSLGFTIGLIDVFGKANSLNQNTFSNYIIEIYLALALLYWGVSVILEKVLHQLEVVFSYDKGRSKAHEA